MISESPEPHKAWLQHPKLRPVEVFPARDPNGQEAVGLRDPSRIAPEVLFLSPAALVILQMLDGNHELTDIQAELMRMFGELIALEIIGQLIETLDRHFFLESPTFDSFLIREKEVFAALELRPAFLAGQAYPSEPEALNRDITSYFLHPSGPGRIGRSSDGATGDENPPAGLIAPHIDFSRGGPVYAWAYHQERLDPPWPDTVIVLGTAHAPTRNPLALCEKDFQTPYGALRCDGDFIRELRQRVGPWIMEDEFIHKGEHSVEFQAIWLMSQAAAPENLRVIPVICGSFHRLIDQGMTPEDDPALMDGLAAMKDLIGRYRSDGREVLVLASADLSHVGPQFGDEYQVTPELAEAVKKNDLAMLDLAAQGDHLGFYNHVADQSDATHVCGLACIYNMIRLLDGEAGRVLAYDQWVDENGQGMVTFAGLRFS